MRKAGDPKEEALQRLRSFLDAEEPQCVEFLSGFWRGQQARMGYGAIQEMIVSHNPSSALLAQWRQDYAMFVNSTLAPQWQRMMQAAAQERRLQFPGLVYDPMIDAAQEYIRQRSAELVTMFTENQQRAVQQMIAQAVQLEGMTADHLSRMIRPTIGLTAPQAKANLRYWHNAWQNGVEAGLSSRAAEARADRMAATYAARQHRYRAMNIARTELAMAYNEGIYGATLAAQEQGFLGDVTKTWLTAADERVCPICIPLDGVTVNMNGFFPNIGAKMPPAHPMCRCAVAFVEINSNLQPQRSHGILGSGGVDDTDGHTTITDVRRIDFADEAAVNAEIDSFINAHANDSVENALVITPTGNVYRLRGNEVTVNPGILGRSELAGSIVVHNHPGPNADSFSRKDFISFFDMGFSREDVVFGNSHHILRHNGLPISADRAAELYCEAFAQVRWNALDTGVPIGLEQLEIMQQLSRTTEGLIFHENTR